MASGKSGKRLLLSTACLFVSCAIFASASIAAENVGLWQVYETALKSAKYVDLTHTITPRIPVWVGFAESTFSPAKAGADLEGFARKGEVYTYQKHGFEATEYMLRTDQLGTQLDPRRTGHRNTRPSMNSRQVTQSGRSSSYRSRSK